MKQRRKKLCLGWLVASLLASCGEGQLASSAFSIGSSGVFSSFSSLGSIEADKEFWNQTYAEDQTYVRSQGIYASRKKEHWEKGTWVEKDFVAAGSLENKELVSTSATPGAWLFTLPQDGKVTIKGKFTLLNGRGTEVAGFYNNEKIYSSTVYFSSLNLEGGVNIEFETEGKANEKIALVFVGEGTASFSPIASYGVKEKLYSVPKWNFYGDVHPFYYQGKMYMYNLQGYLEDVGNERYLWCLHTSKDLFHYAEEDYQVFDFVHDHYNSTLSAYDSIFDKITFPYGSRDMFLFYDKLADRYDYIGLCYYQDYSSCLGMRVSDDPEGMSWSNPMYSIRDFPVDCDPECTQAMLIENRWYLLTSVWGQSIHSVGRPSYLIGDEGKPFAENDWANKEFHYLDGEDLCAAQLVRLEGEDKDRYQIYGWIPKTSYGNDQDIYFNGTRDHGLWGGNINMPREIYVGEEGELFSRLDEKASQLLSRGNQLDLTKTVSEIRAGSGKITEGQIYLQNQGENIFQVSSMNFQRTFIETDLDMSSASEAGLILDNGGKSYHFTVQDKDGKEMISISCPDDAGHPVASSFEIGPLDKSKVNLKVISDGSLSEMYIDGKYALTARISMFNPDFHLQVYSKGLAVFTNLQVNKLSTVDDIFD
ncbi:MAG: glycoside hydrolase family 32 protein [Bacilli bacterium]|nr:glycoside hydrolase family 32 protein [Bacilli bacterium]